MLPVDSKLNVHCVLMLQLEMFTNVVLKNHYVTL